MKIFSVPALAEPAVNQTNNRTADNTLFMGTASNLFVNMVGFLLASFNAAIKFTLAIKLASSANKTCTAHVITGQTGLDSTFQAVDFGFQVLDSSVCQWNLDQSRFQ